MDEPGRETESGAEMETKSHTRKRRTQVADTLPVHGATPQADVAPREAAPNAVLDPRDSRAYELLQRRTATGGYEVSDANLVRGIRHWQEHGDDDNVRRLSEVLVNRCMPEFQRRTYGLRQRPELREDTIAAMIEQLLREARDPEESFMTKNFIHYLRCLCADQFNRTLRQEGLSYRRDERGNPAGRGHHIPRALMESLDIPPAERDDDHLAREIPDTQDDLNARLGVLQAETILRYLPDPLDRQIMVLRVLEGLQWEEIAGLCGKTERTMRLRFEKAKVTLAARLGSDDDDGDSDTSDMSGDSNDRMAPNGEEKKR